VTFGLSDLRIIEPSDYRTFGLSSSHPCGYWHVNVRLQCEAADTFWAQLAQCTWVHQA